MKTKLLGPIGAAISFIGFFSPWVSCGVIEFSGFDLAAGNSDGALSSGGTIKGVEGDMMIWFVLLASIAIMTLYVVFQKRGKLHKAMIPTIGSSVLALAILAAKYIDIENVKEEYHAQSTKQNVDGFGNVMEKAIRLEWGYWLSALAFAASIAGAWNYKDEDALLADNALGKPLPDDGSHMNQDLGM